MSTISIIDLMLTHISILECGHCEQSETIQADTSLHTHNNEAEISE